MNQIFWPTNVNKRLKKKYLKARMYETEYFYFKMSGFKTSKSFSELEAKPGLMKRRMFARPLRKLKTR